MNVRKILATMVIWILFSQSVFAYDLNDSDKSKGDVITQKIVSLILKKPEEKRSEYAGKIIEQLSKMMRGNNSEKVSALIGYVIEGVTNANPNKQGNIPSSVSGLSVTVWNTSNTVTSKSWTVATQYPGCPALDIVLPNWQVWATCDVGFGYKFTWGSNVTKEKRTVNFGEAPLPDITKVVGDKWNAQSPKWPCEKGYHIPSLTELKSALQSTHSISMDPSVYFDNKINRKEMTVDGLAKILNMGEDTYWTSEKPNGVFWYTSFYFNIIVTNSQMMEQNKIRCIRD